MKPVLALLTFLIAPTFVFASSAVSRGGYSGGGSDYHEIGYGTAWFLGTTPINYCIDLAADFGVPLDTVQKEFEVAATTWRKYIQDRAIHTSSPPERRLNLNLKYSGGCKGTEELKLYFGVESKEVREVKKNFENPYAFAHRSSYDIETRMGKGFLWFARAGSLFPKAGPDGFPNWTRPHTLHAMMLHELGHILGVGHMEGTIMRESNISSMQVMDVDDPWNVARGAVVLRSIDDFKILKFSEDAAITIPGRISNYENKAEEVKATFKTFMNRAPAGKVRLTFKSFPYELEIADDVGEETFRLIARRDLVSSFTLLSRAFGIHFKDEHPSGSSYNLVGFSGSGTITSLSGRTYPVQYSVNAEGRGPVKITYIDGNQVKDLFVSNIAGSILEI